MVVVLAPALEKLERSPEPLSVDSIAMRVDWSPSTFYLPPWAPPRAPSTPPPLHTFSGFGLLLGEGKGGGVPEIALTRQMTPKGVGG